MARSLAELAFMAGGTVMLYLCADARPIIIIQTKLFLGPRWPAKGESWAKNNTLLQRDGHNHLGLSFHPSIQHPRSRVKRGAFSAARGVFPCSVEGKLEGGSSWVNRVRSGLCTGSSTSTLSIVLP